MGNIRKGSNFIANGTTLENNDLIKEKAVECPNSVCRLGIIGPSVSTSGSLRQALDPKKSGGKGRAGSGCDLPTPKNCFRQHEMQYLSGIRPRGQSQDPMGQWRLHPRKSAPLKKIAPQTIELSGMIHKRPIRVLLDSGSTDNYSSDRVGLSFDLIIHAEEGAEQLTLADGSKVQA